MDRSGAFSPRLALACLATALAATSGCGGCGSSSNEDHAQPTSPSMVTTTTSDAATANDSPIPSASVEAYLNPHGLPAYTGATGSVEGVIYVAGDPPPRVTDLDFSKCPAAESTYGLLFRAGPPVPSDAGVAKRPVADAVVAITGYSGFFIPARGDAKRVRFEGCALPSRTITLTFGQRLEIANGSKLLFAPALAELPNPALMLVPPEEHGDPVKLYPRRPGHFTLVDSVRSLPYLRADVYAMLHPLHAASDVAGHYRIDGVPTGKLVVNARLPAIQREVSAPVEVLDGVVQRVDLVLDFHSGAAPIADDAGAKRDAGRLPNVH